MVCSVSGRPGIGTSLAPVICLAEGILHLHLNLCGINILTEAPEHFVMRMKLLAVNMGDYCILRWFTEGSDNVNSSYFVFTHHCIQCDCHSSCLVSSSCFTSHPTLHMVLIQANSFSQAGRCFHLALHGRCPSRHGKMIGPVKCLVFTPRTSTKNSSLRAFWLSKSVQNGAHLPVKPKPECQKAGLRGVHFGRHSHEMPKDTRQMLSNAIQHVKEQNVKELLWSDRPWPCVSLLERGSGATTC